MADDAADTRDNELDTIKVIGITPQQGAELPESAIPYNVQTTTAGALDRSQTFNITDYMNRNLTGVTINSAQSNPLQPNLQFRGFTASPLLGGSEGVSVYVDGVRVNEVFGDSVNWDLIPEEIISTMSVISGANPVYGLNTLGGAIEITTRNGFSDPGMHIQSTDGSWGRRKVRSRAAATTARGAGTASPIISRNAAGAIIRARTRTTFSPTAAIAATARRSIFISPTPKRS